MKTSDSYYEDSHPTEARLVLALDDELERHEAATITRHVAACDVCRAQWEQLRRVSEQVVELHDALCSTGIRACVPPPVVTLSRKYLAAAAVAAALVVAGWFALHADRHNPAPRQVAEQKKPTATPAPQVLATVSHAKPRRSTVTRMPEVASFIALPFSNDALPLADATVVRVELPVQELRLAGLTFDGDGAGALVQADVLMGIDGLPRGIRFVQ